MDFGPIIAQMRKKAVDNSPSLLTAIGVTGVVTTAVLSYRAGIKAVRILDEEHHHFIDPDHEMSRVDILKKQIEFTWKTLIPPVGSGIATVVCVVMANRIGAKRSAALASAYAVTQQAYHEYKTKVIDKVGEAKEKKIYDEIVQDRVNRDPPSVLIASNMTSLWKDLHSGRYFDCDMETIRSAVNDINEEIFNGGYPSLTDFWDKIGLAGTSDSDELGWNTDYPLKIYYAAAVHDGRPVGTIEFRTTPVRNNYKLY
jgi:hypothetical protein